MQRPQGRRQKTARRLTAIASIVAIICLLSTSLLFAEEEKYPLDKLGEMEIAVGATLDIYGKYIWRGQSLVDDPVFQPGASVGYKNLTAAIWGNYDFDDNEDWTEVDYIVDYTTSLGFINEKLETVSASGGYIYYAFPNLTAGDDTQEVYAGIAVDTHLSPSLTIYHDYDQGDGTYYEAGVSHSVDLSEKLTLNLSATVGYNDGQWDFDSSFSSALLGVSLSIPLTENGKVSIEPGIFYSVALDSQYDDEVYAGFSFAVEL